MVSCPPGYTIVTEGLARICVPNPDLYRRSDGVYEPAWAPVFYNPAMVENRDIATAMLRALAGEGYEVRIAVDAMCSTGVRGIRFLKEVPCIDRAILIDVDENAVKLSRMNAEINDVSGRVEILRADCREYLYMAKRLGLRLDYVDIDPFGSPAPYTQAAIECVRNGGVVAFTATDLAPLEGKYPKKLFRRYGVLGKQCAVSKHLAIRNLLAYIARVAATVDRYIEPIYSYYYRHYIRIYVVVKKGKNKAYEMLEKCLGVVNYCPRCGYWAFSKVTLDRCPVCGESIDNIVGTWICDSARLSIANKVANVVKRFEWYSSSSQQLAEAISKEIEVGNVLPYRISLIARVAKCNMPKPSMVVEELRSLGYKATRTYEYPDGVVTNAPMEVLLRIVRDLSSSR